MKTYICLLVVAHVALLTTIIRADANGGDTLEWTVPPEHSGSFREMLDNAAARYPKLPQRRKLRSHIAEILMRFCEENDPSSHGLVTALLERHKGKEEILLAALRKKYKEDMHVPPAKVLAGEPIDTAQSAPADKKATQHGTSALVIGSREFLGRNIALELRKSKKYRQVFLLDEIQREMLVEPWQIAESILSALMPNAPLLDAKVALIRCDRSQACLQEVLVSRHWDLVVDISAGDKPRPDAMLPAIQAATTIGHYVLVTTAAIYSLCQPADGRVHVLTEDQNDHDCPNDAKATPWRRAWQTLEQPLWETNHSLSFTVLRVPDVLGDLDPSRSLAPFMAKLATGDKLPGGLSGLAKGRHSFFSIAHDSDVTNAVLRLAAMTQGSTWQGRGIDAARSQAFNIAAAQKTSLFTILQRLGRMAQVEIEYDESSPSPFPRVIVPCPLDTSKSVEVLGVRPSNVDNWLLPLAQFTVTNFFDESRKPIAGLIDFDDEQVTHDDILCHICDNSCSITRQDWNFSYILEVY